MENLICTNCKNCECYNDTDEPFKTIDSNGVEIEWYQLKGANCRLSQCSVFDVVKCEKYEPIKKQEEQ